MLSARKEKIQKSFDKQSKIYEKKADIQKLTAQKLCNFIDIPEPNNILEIGCGTGLLTDHLIQKYPKSTITAIDIAENMVKSCRDRFKDHEHISFHAMDGEALQFNQKFDLIVSNMSIQWFENIIEGIGAMKKHLTSEGSFYYSTIGSHNFQEWRTTLNTLSFENGLLNVPNYQDIFEEDYVTINYDQTETFLQNIKEIGAHNSRTDYQKLSNKKIKQACKACNEEYQGHMTWHILYGKS